MARPRFITLIALTLLAPAALHAQRASSRGYGVEAPPPAPAPAPRPVYTQPRVIYVVTPQILYVNPDGTISVLAPYVMLTDGSMLVTYAADYQRPVPRCAPPPPPTPAVAMVVSASSRGQVVSVVPPREANACYMPNASGTPNVRVWR